MCCENSLQLPDGIIEPLLERTCRFSEKEIVVDTPGRVPDEQSRLWDKGLISQVFDNLFAMP